MTLIADGWVEAGTIAAVVAAVAGIAAVTVALIYGRRTDKDARTAIQYERLREARDLVSTVQRTGNNTGWPECNDACRRLKALLPQLGGSFPNVTKLVGIQWDLDVWSKEGFPALSAAAVNEVDQAVKELG